jgi:hypothetical protein
MGTCVTGLEQQLTSEEFAAYWSEREPGFRQYVAGQARRDDIVDEVLGYARADLEANLESLGPEPHILGAVYRYVAPFIPRVNDETHAIICALEETGQVEQEGTFDERAARLASWHEQELANDRPYHPVVRHIDLSKVDWVDVALGLSFLEA